MAHDAATRFLAIARIVRPQGRRGEVLAEILTDFPDRFQELRRAYLEDPGHGPVSVDVENIWHHKGRVVIKFSGVDSIDQAAGLRGLCVLIPREERTALPPDHYYHWELQGCRVVREREGKTVEIGTVVSIEPTGGVDVLHVATPRGEILIPLAQAICTRIDGEKKTIWVDPPEDLLDLNA